MPDAQPRMRVLVVAYGCEPGRGSEGGAGWGVVQALQRFSDCTVITGPESGAPLERWKTQNPDTSLNTMTIREPLWAPALRRNRIGQFLVYLAWQRRAGKVGRRLVAARRFDVALHASLSTFWLPSVVIDLGLPSVWGPVGGAVTTARKLWPLLGWRGTAIESIDWLAVRLMSLLPGTRRTWREAGMRIAQNEETVRRLPRDLQSGTAVLSHAVFHEVPVRDAVKRPEVAGNYVAWVSAMESRKGPELAVRALAVTSPGIEMIMAGDGPERPRLEDLARELGISDRIRFEGRVSHDRALEIIGDGTVALFTGMREEGGLALAEAMLLGTPVVVLANGGAATIARSSTDPSRVSMIAPTGVSSTIAAIATALEHQIAREQDGVFRERSSLLDQDAAVRELEVLVRSAYTSGMRSGE